MGPRRSVPGRGFPSCPSLRVRPCVDLRTEQRRGNAAFQSRGDGPEPSCRPCAPRGGTGGLPGREKRGCVQTRLGPAVSLRLGCVLRGLGAVKHFKPAESLRSVRKRRRRSVKGSEARSPGPRSPGVKGAQPPACGIRVLILAPL